MQHQPHSLILIQTYFDEVVSAIVGPDLPPDSTFVESAKPRTDRQSIKPRVKLLDLSIKLERLKASAVVHLRGRLVKVEPYGYVALDLRSIADRLSGRSEAVRFNFTATI